MLEFLLNLVYIILFVVLILFLASIAFFISIAIACQIEDWHKNRMNKNAERRKLMEEKERKEGEAG